MCKWVSGFKCTCNWYQSIVPGILLVLVVHRQRERVALQPQPPTSMDPDRLYQTWVPIQTSQCGGFAAWAAATATAVATFWWLLRLTYGPPLVRLEEALGEYLESDDGTDAAGTPAVLQYLEVCGQHADFDPTRRIA